MIPKITIAAAMVLSLAATTASAAIKHRHPPRANAPIYNAGANRGAVGGVSLSTACKPTDSPCRTQPDAW
jgi:hypothetical protein